MSPAPDSAALKQRLDEALHAVVEWQSLPDRKQTEAEEPIWQQLRQIVRETRQQPWVLQAVPDDHAAAVLRFLVAWASKRRVLRAKVVETLQLLLANPPFLRAARSTEELKTSMELLLPLPESVPPAKAPVVVEDGKVTGGGEAALHAVDPTLRQEVRGALDSLVSALQALRKFDWTFPPESSQNANRDAAVDAFRSLFLGVSRLHMVVHREGSNSVDKYGIAAALEAYRSEWSGVLRFLVSLHRVRRVFSSQVSSLTGKLSELSTSFEEAVKEVQDDLPRANSQEGTNKLQAKAEVSAAAADAAKRLQANRKEPPSAHVHAERSVFVGSRVEAIYEGRWYSGTVISVPAEDAEGRWIVQCDVDEPGMLTYAKSISSRVEAFYEGEWYSGSVVAVPSEDPENGRWAVQCDVDPPGTLTYTTTVRLAGEPGTPTSTAADKEAVAASALPATPTEAAPAPAPAAAAPVEGIPLQPAPPTPQTERRNLGALARLPGTATPPPSAPPTHSLGVPVPLAQPLSSPSASQRVVEVERPVTPRTATPIKARISPVPLARPVSPGPAWQTTEVVRLSSSASAAAASPQGSPSATTPQGSLQATALSSSALATTPRGTQTQVALPITATGSTTLSSSARATTPRGSQAQVQMTPPATGSLGSSSRSVQVTVEVLPPAPRSTSLQSEGGCSVRPSVTPPTPRGGSIRVPVSEAPQPSPLLSSRTLHVPVSVRSVAMPQAVPVGMSV